jgi:hypothetical protein
MPLIGEIESRYKEYYNFNMQENETTKISGSKKVVLAELSQFDGSPVILFKEGLLRWKHEDEHRGEAS